RGRIDLNLAKLRDAEGLPAEEVNRLRLAAMTNLHAGVVNQMIANKEIGKVDAYLKKYADEIDAATLLKATTLAKKEGDTLTALSVAREAVRPAAQALNTDDFGRLVHLVGARESGN